MAVTVYSTPTCPYCTMAKKYLTQSGIAFVEKDVSRDPVAAQELARMGERGVPVIDIDGQKVVGFNKPLLEQLLARRKNVPRPRKLGAAIADSEGHAPAGSPPGAFVGRVRPGSAAALGGLREGDIITTIAGQPVRAAGDVEQILARAPEHAQVPLQVIRQWQPMEVVVEL